jgi:hypothetical protein
VGKKAGKMKERDIKLGFNNNEMERELKDFQARTEIEG